MSESSLISSIKSIISSHITNYQIEVISRVPNKESSMDVTVAVIFKDHSITEALIKDLITFQVNQNREVINFETKKELGNLDFEVILITAEILYLE